MSKQNISLTTDCVIFTGDSSNPKVLLVQRKINPFLGKWALPGGFLHDKEPLEIGAKRELEEETGLQVENLQQIKVFGAPDRDPRGRTVTIGFWTQTYSEEKAKGMDDASDARWLAVKDLPELAFDHKMIIEAGLEQFRRQSP